MPLPDATSEPVTAEGRPHPGLRALAPTGTIRAYRDGDRTSVLTVINAAAAVYRGVIPADRWHDPYMDPAEFDTEIAAGVSFSVDDRGGDVVAVMGIQAVRDVDLIRHAYVAPAHQGRGLGAGLLRHLQDSTRRPLLVGTWAAAHWAIGFYEHHGFHQVAPDRAAQLLRTYWTVPDRQIETSVVLTDQPAPTRHRTEPAADTAAADTAAADDGTRPR